MKAIKVSAALIALFGLGAVNTASAGICTKGFLADALCITGLIDQETAQGLDRLHDDFGNPLNQLNPFDQGGRGGARPMPLPMGNFCITPAGRFGPGPVNPLGSPCWAHGPWGPVNGYVGR